MSYIINYELMLWDLLIVITAESLAHLDGILKEVRGVKGVLNSETSIILSTTEK